MKLDQNQSAELDNTIRTEGFEVIKEWFDSREDAIVEAIKHTITQLNWDESPKWGAYYSGQMAVIENFRSFIDAQLTKDVKKGTKKIEIDADFDD